MCCLKGETEMCYRDETGKFAHCPECGDNRYLIATRDDGFEAIERCDACQILPNGTPAMFDSDASLLAQCDGIAALHDYPCYVIGRIH
jgi:hypothetical protein